MKMYMPMVEGQFCMYPDLRKQKKLKSTPPGDASTRCDTKRVPVSR